MALPPIMASIKAGIDKKTEEDVVAKEEVFGLGTADEPEHLTTIREALAKIKGLFEQETIPTNTIEIGLKEVMKLLKKYEDVALELEPEDISTIVTSYMALSEEEVKTIFDKAAKKKAKPKASASVKKILAAAKEDSGDIDLSNLEF